MTTAQYLGVALCYDQANLALYENACKVVNPEGNAYQITGNQFACSGALIHNFYDALVDGGETNVCVCSYANTGSWTFQAPWGPCNGACTQSYTCNGVTPVVSGNSNNGGGSISTTTSKAAPVTSTSAATSPIGPSTSSSTATSHTVSLASSSTTTSTTAPLASSSTTIATSLAVPLDISWKTFLGVAAVILFNAIV
jgi:hypothetical protein